MEQLVLVCENCRENFDLTGYEPTTQFQCTCGKQLYHPQHPQHPSRSPSRIMPGLPPLTAGVPGQPSMAGMIPFPTLVPMEPLSSNSSSGNLPSVLPTPSSEVLPSPQASPQMPSSSLGPSIQIGGGMEEPQATMQQPGFTLDEMAGSEFGSELSDSLRPNSTEQASSQDLLPLPTFSKKKTKIPKDLASESQEPTRAQNKQSTTPKHNDSSSSAESIPQAQNSLDDLEAKSSEISKKQELRKQNVEFDQLRKDFEQLQTDWKVQQDETKEIIILVQQQWSQIQEERVKAHEELETAHAALLEAKQLQAKTKMQQWSRAKDPQEAEENKSSPTLSETAFQEVEMLRKQMHLLEKRLSILESNQAPSLANQQTQSPPKEPTQQEADLEKPATPQTKQETEQPNEKEPSSPNETPQEIADDPESEMPEEPNRSVQPDTSNIPETANWSDKDNEWSAGTTKQDDEGQETRDGLWKFWSKAGMLLREATYTQGQKEGVVRTFDPETGLQNAEYNYANDDKNGLFWEIVPPHVMLEPKITTMRGSYQKNALVGKLEWLDENGNLILSRERGQAYQLRAWIRVAAAPKTTDFGKMAEDMLEAQQNIAYLLASIRHAAQNREFEALRELIQSLAPPLTEKQTQTVTEKSTRASQQAHAADKSLHGIKMMLEGILDGGEVASAIRDIASLFNDCIDAQLLDGKLDPYVAHDCITVGSNLASEHQDFEFSHALIAMSAGYPEESQAIIAHLNTHSEDEAAFLMCYFNAVYPTYSFWPENDERANLVNEAEPLEGIDWDRSWEDIKWVIQTTASRLDYLRTEQSKRLSSQDTNWLIPSLDSLLPEGVLQLKPENRPLLENNLMSLNHTIRSEWNRLVWLCWLAGMDTLELPDNAPKRRNISKFIGLHNVWFLLAASIYKEEPIETQNDFQEKLLDVDWFGFALGSLSYVHADFVCRDCAELTPTLQWLLNETKESPFPKYEEG